VKNTVILMFLLSLSGCNNKLQQEFSVVKTVPISEEYRLKKGLNSSICVFLAKTSTGQEQYSKMASHSLARVLQRDDKNDTILSFADFSNKIKKEDLFSEFNSLSSFYKTSGMLKYQELKIIREKIGVDYFIIPGVLNLSRVEEGRFSAAGVKLLSTQKVCLVVDMEIWDKQGYFVFGASSDITMSDERWEENPISLEEAFEHAWQSIINEINK